MESSKLHSIWISSLRVVCVAVFVSLNSISVVVADDVVRAIEPIVRTVDLNIGDEQQITLCDGETVTVRLVGLTETRDSLRDAVRVAKVIVEVNDELGELTSATYNLPQRVGGVQVDCPVTRGYVASSSKQNAWSLEKQARIRLWPDGSPWIRPGTLTYPVRQRWFASDTQMANDPCYVNGGGSPRSDEHLLPLRS